MLVLTRKQGEQIRIGADVVITVVRTKGKAVRLGIQAPAHVAVLRGEIAVAIADDEKQKTTSADEHDDHDDEPWPGAAESERGTLLQLVAARGV
jgi:carbon storage regulator